MKNNDKKFNGYSKEEKFPEKKVYHYFLVLCMFKRGQNK